MQRNKLYESILILAGLVWQVFNEIKTICIHVPIRSMYAFSTLNFSQALAFVKSDINEYLHRLKMYSVSLQLSLLNGIPTIQVKSYYEEVERLNNTFSGKKVLNTKTYLREAFQALKDCTFLILQPDQSGIKFIQFSYNTGSYCLDFPLTPLNLNRDHSVEIITSLQKKGFSKYNTVKTDAFIYKTYTIYSVDDELTIISANFGNNLDLVVSFSDYVLSRVFHSSKRPEIKFI